MTTTSRPWYRLLAVMSVPALVLVGCSSDDSSDEAATGTGEAADSTEMSDAMEDTDAADEAEPADSEAALFAAVPEVPNATQTGQEDIQEGGLHIYGTVDDSPANSVDAYTALLEKNDWTVEGSGGDPTGESGAGLQATHADGRYLDYNVGGPGEGISFGDLCLWPSKPDDTNCPQQDQDQQRDQDQDDNDGDDGDDGGPPAGIEGFIPDEVEQFIP